MTKETRQALIISAAILFLCLAACLITIERKEIKRQYWWWCFNHTEKQEERLEIIENFKKDGAALYLIRIVKLNAWAVEVEKKKLYPASNNIFWAAVDALGQMGAPAVEPLVEVLNDENENVRYVAGKALYEIGDPRTVEPMIKALKDKSGDIRFMAALALGKIRDARAVGPLIDALNDPERSVSGNAGAALVAIGAPSVEPLIKVLATNHEVANILGEIGDKRALEPLKAALNSEQNNALRWFIRGAIEKIEKANNLR